MKQEENDYHQNFGINLSYCCDQDDDVTETTAASAVAGLITSQTMRCEKISETGAAF